MPTLPVNITELVKKLDVLDRWLIDNQVSAGVYIGPLTSETAMQYMLDAERRAAGIYTAHQDHQMTTLVLVHGREGETFTADDEKRLRGILHELGLPEEIEVANV